MKDVNSDNRYRVYLKKHQKADWLIKYTGLFAILTILVYGWLFLLGKSAVWTVDGLPQHYNVMMYIRSWIRETISSLLRGGAVPLYDLGIGQGNDILSTFHYYGFTDPFNWAVVIVPTRLVEVYYSALAIFRIWASGVAFGYYCHIRNKNRYASLVGALIYSFSFWSIAAGTRHPFFIIPMMYFPLILAGIEKIFEGKRPYLFILTVMLSVMSNFYFFYMLCIFMFIYAVFRYVAIFGKVRFLEVVGWLGKFIGFFGIGLGAATVAVMPFAMTILSSARAGAVNYVPVLYSLDFYQKFLVGFIGGEAGNWTELGFTGFGLFGVILLFAAKKKRTELKIGFILMSVMMLLPVFGYAINGFSYVCNRGSWAYAALVAYIVVETLPELLELDQSKKKTLGIASAVYISVAIAFANGRTEIGLVACVLTALSLVVILLLGDNKPMQKKAIIVLVCICLGAQGSLRFSFVNENYTANVYADLGAAVNHLGYFSPTTDLAKQQDVEDYRYDQYGVGDVYNTGLLKGLYSTSHYWSVSNHSLEELSREMYFNHRYDHMYEGFDGRTLINTVFSVGYFMARDKQYAPKGYEEVATASKDTTIFKNTNALPFVYKYDSVISREEYEKMTVTQKQQAILQGAVVDCETELPKTEIEFLDVQQGAEPTLSDGAEFCDGYINVTSAGATLRFTLDGIADSETYFIIEGLDYKGVSPAEIASQNGWKGYTPWYKTKTLYEDLYWQESQAVFIKVSTEHATKELVYSTPKDNFYTGRHNFLVNLGYSAEETNTLTVRFPAVGKYYYCDMRVVSQKLDQYDNWVEQMKADVTQEFTVGTNTMSVTVKSPNSQFICFSVPYSEGWTATVNGKPTEIVKTNTMFMSVKVDAGENEIVLSYTTPYINIALVISAVSIVAFGIIIAIYETKNKKRKRT